MGVTVTAPDGRAWTVRRRFPWPQWRRIDDVPYVGGGGSDGGSGSDDGGGGFFDGGDGDGCLVALLGIVLVVALVLVFTFVVLPLLIFLLELVLVAIGAFVFGRPWLVEAATAGPPPETLVWKVRGFRGSRQAAREVARELEQGVEAAPASVEPLVR